MPPHGEFRRRSAAAALLRAPFTSTSGFRLALRDGQDVSRASELLAFPAFPEPKPVVRRTALASSLLASEEALSCCAVARLAGPASPASAAGFPSR
jgi:hypothetical protein